MTTSERISEINRLDCENQHVRYYFQGYRESMLTLIHGENFVWTNLVIDVDRYSPDSARRNSYDEGWKDAVNDFNLK